MLSLISKRTQVSTRTESLNGIALSSNYTFRKLNYVLDDQKTTTTPESTKGTAEVKAEPTPGRRGRKKKQPEPPAPELNTSVVNESQDDGSTDQEDEGWVN